MNADFPKNKGYWIVEVNLHDFNIPPTIIFQTKLIEKLTLQVAS